MGGLGSNLDFATFRSQSPRNASIFPAKDRERASGSATTPTTTPANTLLRICARVHKPSAFARRRAIMSAAEGAARTFAAREIELIQAVRTPGRERRPTTGRQHERDSLTKVVRALEDLGIELISEGGSSSGIG